MHVKKFKAAALIQAFARGTNVRSGLARAYLRAAASARQKFIKKLNYRVTLLQSHARGNHGRRMASRRKRAAATLTHWAKRQYLRSRDAENVKLARAVALASAAINIQRIARGRLGRRDALAIKRVLQIRRELFKRQRLRNSANTIQAFMRLWVPRYKLKMKIRQTKEKKSATVIQRKAHDWILCRKAAQQLAALKTLRRAKLDRLFVISVVDLVLESSEKWRKIMDTRRTNAASHVQRLWRGFSGRKIAKSAAQTRAYLRRHLAASQIQCIFKEYKYRKLCHYQATRMQAFVRRGIYQNDLSRKKKAILLLQCCMRSRIARIRANTVRTIRWFNRRNSATFVIQRFMRLWMARVSLEKERLRVIEETKCRELHAARRIQARLRGWSTRQQLKMRRANERRNQWLSLILALRVAKEIQNIIMEGQASRWQALHGSVKSSHGVFKLRRAVLADGIKHQSKISDLFDHRKHSDFVGRGTTHNHKYKLNSPNRARRILRSRNPQRFTSKPRFRPKQLNNDLGGSSRFA